MPLPEGMPIIDQYIHWDNIEKEAKAHKDALKEIVQAELVANNKFVRTEIGGLQYSETTRKSANDSLKFFLQEHNVLHLCKKDEIDLKKVEELAKGNIIPQEVYEHITVSKTPTLKQKK